MNKMKKAIIGLAVGAVAALGVVGFAACGSSEQTVEGEYSYENHSNTYGVKVEVTVDGDTIKSVKVVDNGKNWIEATPDNYGDESWDKGVNYNAKRPELLSKFEGLKVDDVLALVVKTNDVGEPLKQEDEGFNAYNVGKTELLISGSTQSVGRLILAVQDALENL